jgi:DNA-3-methyladenine glycosylase I
MAMKQRCSWCGDDPLYVKYHDEEWGVPVYNDKKLFEFILLEGAQAGLSWITVLRKRAAYRQAFDGFDFNKIAGYKPAKLHALLQNPGIIRNRLKIESAVRNANAFIEIRREFGTFNNYIWAFVDGKPVQSSCKTLKDIPPTSQLSDVISTDLKKRGFNFVGSTIIYSHMQATGIVNDHVLGCFRYQQVRKLSGKR